MRGKQNERGHKSIDYASNSRVAKKIEFAVKVMERDLPEGFLADPLNPGFRKTIRSLLPHTLHGIAGEVVEVKRIADVEDRVGR